MRSRHTMSVVFGCALMLTATTAFADTSVPGADTTVNPQAVTQSAQVLNVASGAKRGRIDGEQRLRYPGFEQSTVAYTKNHLVVVTMEAVQEPGKAPVQCSCSSYEMQPNGAPKLVTNLKRLTDYSNGERTCNHPMMAADGPNGDIVWGYGSDYNSNRPN